jgi:hypothetical protein
VTAVSDALCQRPSRPTHPRERIELTLDRDVAASTPAGPRSRGLTRQAAEFADAAIVLTERATITPEELFAFFCEQVPSYAVPRYVELIDELPRTAVGRIMKYRLRGRSLDGGVWDFERLGFGCGPTDPNTGGPVSRQAEHPQRQTTTQEEQKATARCT